VRLRLSGLSVSRILAGACIAAGLAASALLGACRTTGTAVPAYGFGMTLGQKLDKTTAQPMDALIQGRSLYRVRPPQPHRDMSEYALIADVSTDTILGVVGWDRYSDNAACGHERDGLARVLESRYGPGHAAEAAERERMRGLPELLVAPDLTLYAGAVGPIGLGCAGPRLMMVYWWIPLAAPDAQAPATK
jgi:hypothetical protein